MLSLLRLRLLPAVAGCWQLLPEGADSPVPAELWLQLCLHAAWQCSSFSSGEYGSVLKAVSLASDTAEQSRNAVQRLSHHVARVCGRESRRGVKTTSHGSGDSLKCQPDVRLPPGQKMVVTEVLQR